MERREGHGIMKDPAGEARAPPPSTTAATATATTTTTATAITTTTAAAAAATATTTATAATTTTITQKSRTPCPAHPAVCETPHLVSRLRRLCLDHRLGGHKDLKQDQQHQQDLGRVSSTYTHAVHEAAPVRQQCARRQLRTDSSRSPKAPPCLPFLDRTQDDKVEGYRF